MKRKKNLTANVNGEAGRRNACGQKKEKHIHTHTEYQGDTSTSKMAAARGGSNQKTCCSFTVQKRGDALRHFPDSWPGAPL